MAVGGPAGYLTVEPTQDYIGQALTSVNNDLFRRRAEKREEDQIKAEALEREIEQRNKEFKQNSELNEKYPFVATGTGIDASNMQGVQNAKQTYANAQSNYTKTGDKKYLAIANNAMASLNALSNFPKKLVAIKDDMVANADKYNPTSLKLAAEQLDRLSNGEIIQTNDANGNPRFTLFDRREDGTISNIKGVDMTAEQVLKTVTPVSYFDKNDFVERYKKGLGKERKTTEIVGNKEVTKTYNPGSEELAEVMASDAVKDRDKLYNGLDALGYNPNDTRLYTNPQALNEVKSYYKDMLTAVAPESKSEKSDFKQANFELSKSKFNADQRQRNIDNARKDRKEAEDREERRKDDAKIGSPKNVASAGYTGQKVAVKAGDKIIPVSDKGIKNESGFKSALKEVVVHKDGNITYSFEENNPEDWILSPEGKAKIAKDPEYKPKTTDYLPQKPRTGNYKASGKNAKANEAESGILNVKNPETDSNFKSLQEANEYFTRKSGVKQKAKTSSTSKKYSSIEEKAINTAMKQNPGYSREEIISALKLK